MLNCRGSSPLTAVSPWGREPSRVESSRVDQLHSHDFHRAMGKSAQLSEGFIYPFMGDSLEKRWDEYILNFFGDLIDPGTNGFQNLYVFNVYLLNLRVQDTVSVAGVGETLLNATLYIIYI